MRAFGALLITFGIIFILGTGAYLVIDNSELRKDKSENLKKITRLEDSNNYLSKKNNQLLHENIQKDNQIKNFKKQSKNTYTRKQTYKAPVQKKYTYSKPTKRKSTYVPHKVRKAQQEKKDNKIYHRFSRSIKLVSDSRITVLSNNKLKSNKSIRGRYYPNKHLGVISNVNCGGNERLYKVRNECSMDLTLLGERVYLGKMDARHIKEFDYTNHMIECKYSQKYGVMHDCKAKLIG